MASCSGSKIDWLNRTHRMRNYAHWFIVGLLLSSSFYSGEVLAHPKPQHKPPQSDSTRVSAQKASLEAAPITEMHPMPAPLDDYPTYHPVVVHAPIMLLMLAALLQLVVLFKPSGPLNWLTLAIALGGTVGAYVAGSLVHPHTGELSDAAQHALESHETYADYTLWLGLAGTLLKGITFWRPQKWLEGVTAVALVGAGIAVGMAGDQGGELVYKYGIGPRGAYLEQHDEDQGTAHHHDHENQEEERK
jgi:uncharacterized membrane protein